MWKLETFKLKELTSHPKNPRQLKKKEREDLQESLDKFGLIDKPIINRDQTVIGGHQRLKILKANKVKEVECWVPERTLSEKEVEELNIRLNKNNGNWDWDILANEWDIGELCAWGFEIDDFDISLEESHEDEENKIKSEKKCPHCGGSLGK